MIKIFFFFQNVQPQSVVWGRTDGSVLPPNVYQDGNDLVIRNPSPEKAGNYICTITHPDGNVEYINVQLNYPSGKHFFKNKNQFLINDCLFFRQVNLVEDHNHTLVSLAQKTNFT